MLPRLVRSAGVVLAVLLLAAGRQPSPVPFQSTASEELGAWLPAYFDGFEFGQAGPVKARILFDPVHGIAFYAAGCCSWGTKVLTLASKPPHSVRASDLSDVHTQRGVRLGASISHVREIEGYANLQPVPHHPNLVLLAYAAMLHPNAPESSPNAGCGQFQNFVFREGRLAYIELLDGC